MVSYEEALNIAKGLKQNIDACVEFDNAYMFKLKADDWSIGGDSPCVVLKKNGKAINNLEYYDKYGGEEIREFDI